MLQGNKKKKLQILLLRLRHEILQTIVWNEAILISVKAWQKPCYGGEFRRFETTSTPCHCSLMSGSGLLHSHVHILLHRCYCTNVYITTKEKCKLNNLDIVTKGTVNYSHKQCKQQQKSIPKPKQNVHKLYWGAPSQWNLMSIHSKWNLWWGKKHFGRQLALTWGSRRWQITDWAIFEAFSWKVGFITFEILVP